MSKTQSYKQNSNVEFDSTQELTNEISHVTNISLSDRSIPWIESNFTLKFPYSGHKLEHTRREELKELVELKFDRQGGEDGVVDERRPEVGQRARWVQPRVLEQLTSYQVILKQK